MTFVPLRQNRPPALSPAQRKSLDAGSKFNFATLWIVAILLADCVPATRHGNRLQTKASRQRKPERRPQGLLFPMGWYAFPAVPS